jgi:hypothetical protein
MTDGSADSTVVAAISAARLRALRTGLIELHKAIIDVERARFERVHGRIESAQAVLRTVLEDPFFAWVRPFATLIVQMDERAADRVPLRPADVLAFAAEVRGVLTGDLGGDLLRAEYHRSLQESPEVVVAHGRLQALLAQYREP